MPATYSTEIQDRGIRWGWKGEGIAVFADLLDLVVFGVLLLLISCFHPLHLTALVALYSVRFALLACPMPVLDDTTTRPTRPDDICLDVWWGPRELQSKQAGAACLPCSGPEPHYTPKQIF